MTIAFFTITRIINQNHENNQNNPKFRAQQFIDCVKYGTYEFDRIGNSFYQFKLKNYEKKF